MRTWNDYKEYVKATDPQASSDIEESEVLAQIVSTLIERRNSLGLSQRELASRCGLPQSSVARIESFKGVPNLNTLVKIMHPLGLKLTVESA